MYAIIRTQKHTGNATLGGMEKHVDRTMDVPNASKDLEKYNKNHIGAAGTLISSVDARIEKLVKDHNPRITKSSVKCIEYLMTATHDAFPLTASGGNLTSTVDGSKRWKEFKNKAFEFLIKKHGRENIVKFSIHLDEKTPHIHAFVVPVTKDNRLSAKDFLGGKEKLRQLQDEFADTMKPLGLKRGEVGSTAEHESIQKYYGRVNEAQELSLLTAPPPIAGSDRFTLPMPPAVAGRDEWRSKQEQLINDEIKKLDFLLSNERSLVNGMKTRLQEENSLHRQNKATIKKLEARIWHLENPEKSAALKEARKAEQAELKTEVIKKPNNGLSR